MGNYRNGDLRDLMEGDACKSQEVSIQAIAQPAWSQGPISVQGRQPSLVYALIGPSYLANQGNVQLSR